MASLFFGSSWTRMDPLRIWLTAVRYRLGLSGGLGTSAATGAARATTRATATDRDLGVMRRTRTKGRGAQRTTPGGAGCWRDGGIIRWRLTARGRRIKRAAGRAAGGGGPGGDRMWLV